MRCQSFLCNVLWLFIPRTKRSGLSAKKMQDHSAAVAKYKETLRNICQHCEPVSVQRHFSNFTVVVPVAAKAAKAIDAAESPPWEELTTEPPPKVGSWEMSKRQSQANLTKVTDLTDLTDPIWSHLIPLFKQHKTRSSSRLPFCSGLG